MVSLEKIPKLFTLAFLFNGKNEILLGFKKRGFGEGKWNGFGGKVEPGETIMNAAYRELEEECGLKASNLLEHGVITFEFIGDPIKYIVHLFSTTSYIGTLTESDEMAPKWFHINEIPYENMWLDNQYWLPRTIVGNRFNAYFLYENQDKLLKYNIEDIIE